MKKAVRASFRVAVHAAIESLEGRRLLSHFGAGLDNHDLVRHGPERAHSLVRRPELHQGVEYCPPVDPDHLRDRDGGEGLAGAAAIEASPFPLGDTFNLHSRPTATKTVYLDFNGETTTNASWNGGATIVTPEYNVDNVAGFNNSELEDIQLIWQRVSEDFLPFDVNITTAEPPIDDLRKIGSGDTRWGIRVIIGGNGSWYGSAGGVAYVGSFDWSSDTPCFVFEDNLGNGDVKYTAEATSHEVGHTLGLSHDGRTSPLEDYYRGHGSGETAWAPIMGVGYYNNLSQWSKGEYLNANQKQDDLNIITTQNGFGYRPDDHNSTPAFATPISATGPGTLAEGVIERNTDVDVFRIDHAGGEINLNVDPYYLGPNLDIQADLKDAAGTTIASGNNAAQLRATVGANVPAGTYYLHVDGTGKGEILGTGYSDYGSIGSYKITRNTSAPFNNNFVNRITISGNNVSTSGLSLGANKEAGEPNHAGNAGGRSVWWAWTAPASGTFVIDTAGSGFNTLLGVYTGTSVGTLTHVASNDDQTPGSVTTSSLTLNAVSGTNYKIAVDGFDGASGSVSLSITQMIHSVSGRVFNDRNSNGVVDGSETGTFGRRVYLDNNNNGTFDPGGTTTLHSVDVPKSGIDNTTVTSDLIVSGLGSITDVDVNLSITHNWDPDLNVYLISPGGTRVELFTEVGALDADDFINTALDDEASTPITLGAAPFTGSFKPEGLLSAFDGENANGTWKLEVTDVTTPDPGTLTAWSLTISSGEQSTFTDASGNYSINNLVAGTYHVRQLLPPGWMQSTPTPGAAQVVTLSGGVSQGGKNFANFPTTFSGTNGNDSYSVSTAPGGGGANLQILEQPSGQASGIWLIPKATFGTTPLTFNTGGGDDSVVVTHANGNPFDAGAFPITIDGGAGGGDALTFYGSGGADDITATASSLTIGGTVNYTNFERVEIDGQLGLDTVAINGGTIELPASQRFASLDIADGATLRLQSDGDKVLYTRQLSIAATGTLDLTNNDLVYDYTGATPMELVAGWVASGRGDGAWDGFGINTLAAGDGGLTGLGIAEAADVRDLGLTDTGTFSGVTVDGTTIVVKYTYMGDANLDGAITGDDYSVIDFNVAVPNAFGYFNGDFNYDGIISGDDYSVIDFNIVAQGAPL